MKFNFRIQLPKTETKLVNYKKNVILSSKSKLKIKFDSLRIHNKTVILKNNKTTILHLIHSKTAKLNMNLYVIYWNYMQNLTITLLKK